MFMGTEVTRGVWSHMHAWAHIYILHREEEAKGPRITKENLELTSNNFFITCNGDHS